MRDYEKILKDLLGCFMIQGNTGVVDWAYYAGYTIKDIDEELNDQLLEIMREMGRE